MERQQVDWASAMALMLRAGVHSCRGRDERALALFDRASHRLMSLDMGLMAAVARRRYGELMAGSGGRTEIDASEAWMARQGIRDPAALAQMFAPFTKQTT